jgi:hypothetical protein
MAIISGNTKREDFNLVMCPPVPAYSRMTPR